MVDTEQHDCNECHGETCLFLPDPDQVWPPYVFQFLFYFSIVVVLLGISDDELRRNKTPRCFASFNMMYHSKTEWQHMCKTCSKGWQDFQRQNTDCLSPCAYAGANQKSLLDRSQQAQFFPFL